MPLVGPNNGPAYLTGRSRTLTFTFNFAYTAVGYVEFTNIPTNPPSGSPPPGSIVLPAPSFTTPAPGSDGNYIHSASHYLAMLEAQLYPLGGYDISGFVSAGGPLIRVYGGSMTTTDSNLSLDPTTHFPIISTGYPHAPGSDSPKYMHLIDIYVVDPWGNITQDKLTYDLSVLGFYKAYGANVTGTITVTMPVEEAFEVINTGRFPAFDGTDPAGGALNCGPFEREITWYERMKAGSTLVIQIDATTPQGLFSHTINAPVPAGKEYPIASGYMRLSAEPMVQGNVNLFNDGTYQLYYDPTHYHEYLNVNTISGSVTDGNSTLTVEHPSESLIYINRTVGPPFGWAGVVDYTQGVSSAAIILDDLTGDSSYPPGGAYQVSSGTLLATVSAYPDRLINLVGKLYDWNVLHTGDVDFDWNVLPITGSQKITISGGSVNRYDMQQNYELGGTIFWHGIDIDSHQVMIDQQGFTIQTVNTFSPAHLKVDDTWVSSHVISGNQRCLHMGTRYPVGSITHHPSYTVDDGTSIAHWNAISNVAITLNSGIQIDVNSSGNGAATRTFSPAQDWSNYRWLRLHLKTNSTGSPFTVTASLLGVTYPQSKFWRTVSGTGGVNTAIDIDLCVPNRATELLEIDQSQRFIVVPPDTGYLMDPDFWGITSVDTLRFDGLLASETYLITKIELVEKDGTTLTLLGPNGLKNRKGFSLYHYPLPQARTDRRTSLEDRYLELDTSSAVWTERTIQQLLTDMDAHPGWTVSTISTGLSDGYHDISTLPAAFLWGFGATYDPTNLFQVGTDFDLTGSGSLSLYGQDLFENVNSWYWGVGDPYFNDGTYDQTPVDYGYADLQPPFPFRFVKVWSGETFGLALNANLSYNTGASVAITRFDGTSEGSATSDSTGGFATASPFTTDRMALNIDVNSVRMGTGINTWDNAPRRIVVRPGETPNSVSPHNLEGIQGNFFRVFASTDDGSLYFNAVRYWKPIPYAIIVQLTDPPAGSTDSEPHIVYDPFADSLIVLFQRDTSGSFDVLEIVSTDRGQTWSSPVTVFSGGSHPHIVMGSRGNIIRSAYSGGSIVATLQRAGQSGQQSYTFGSISPPDDSFGLAQDIVDPGYWYLHLAGTTGYYSDDFGQTWNSIAGVGISGGVHPFVSVGPSGTVIWSAAVLDTGSIYHIQAQVMKPGSGTVQSPFTLQLSGGAGDIETPNDLFSIQQAPFAPNSWMLTAVDASITPHAVADWEGDLSLTAFTRL